MYISRRNKIEDRTGQEAISVWLCNIRARLWLEFKFYKMMGDLETFKQRWCYWDVICTVNDEELQFTHFYEFM